MTDAEVIQAREQINAIRTDKGHAFNRPGSPAHDAAVRQINALYDKLHPTAAPAAPQNRAQ